MSNSVCLVGGGLQPPWHFASKCLWQPSAPSLFGCAFHGGEGHRFLCILASLQFGEGPRTWAQKGSLTGALAICEHPDNSGNMMPWASNLDRPDEDTFVVSVHD